VLISHLFFVTSEKNQKKLHAQLPIPRTKKRNSIKTNKEDHCHDDNEGGGEGRKQKQKQKKHCFSNRFNPSPS